MRKILNNLFDESEGIGLVLNREEIVMREEIEPLIVQVDGYIDGVVWVTLQDKTKACIEAL